MLQSTLLPPVDMAIGPSPPNGFLLVASYDSIKEGISLFQPEGSSPTVIVKQKDGRIRALDGLCAHKQGELSLGDLVEIEDVSFIICPRHRKKFPGGLHISCESGLYSLPSCLQQQPSEEVKGDWKQRVYPTLIQDGWVFVKDKTQMDE